MRDVEPIPPMLLRVLRLLRILRILRTLKFEGAKPVRDLVMTLIFSIPALTNVLMFLLLIVFIFSVLGVQLFTFVVLQDSINSDRNFYSVNSAALLLFQCLTGDGWSSLMMEAMVDQDSGLCLNADGNCGSLLAIPYFLVFQVKSAHIYYAVSAIVSSE